MRSFGTLAFMTSDPVPRWIPSSPPNRFAYLVRRVTLFFFGFLL
jgi:hypothetical protein